MGITSITPITQYVKDVRQDGPMDYSAYVNDEYVGSKRTRPEAEALADGVVYGLLKLQPEIAELQAAAEFASGLRDVAARNYASWYDAALAEIEVCRG